MTEKRPSLEIIAPSVEEATVRGLAELGLKEEDVEIEVLDTGAKGLFGLRARQARIRLTVKSSLEGAQVDLLLKKERTPVKSTSTVETAPESEEDLEIEPELPQDEDSEALDVAREVVQELIEKMNVQVKVSAHYVQPEDDRGKPSLWVDVNGNDLSILIGPRAETLDALQYISSLIIGKELGHAVPLVVDVEGYRARRAQQLRRLANQMADQAVKTGKRQVLEPMPANERRIIHIELRKNLQVTTESIGEEPRRKITINPKAS